MRCKKAREYYFRNRDGFLSEAEKMKLQEHLAVCGDCSRFTEEMDVSLGLLNGLEELSPSDGFEWNVKRRILQEKTRLLRLREEERKGLSYMVKFAGAAAVAAAVIIVAVFAMFKVPEGPGGIRSNRSLSMNVPGYRYDSRARGVRTAPVMTPGIARPRMVSGAVRSYPVGYSASRSLPFETTELSYSDSLLWENALLRERVTELEKQVIYLRQVIKKMQSGR